MIFLVLTEQAEEAALYQSHRLNAFFRQVQAFSTG